MSNFAMLFRAALVACCLSGWMITGAASTHEIEEELNYAAKIYASIADANCENDPVKFDNFYQNVRKSIQQEGKFEHYFPDKGYCLVDCDTLELYEGKASQIPFAECCNYSQSFSVYLSYGFCAPCSENYPPFKPYRDRINAIERTTVTCQGDIVYPGLKQEHFTWCIYQLSNDGYDIHGCLNASGIIEISSAAAAIHFLDGVWIDTQKHASLNQGVLSITQYNGLIDQALITCSVNNRNMSAIQFIDIDLYGDPGVFYAGSSLPPLPQVVRVGDVIEDFHCAFSTGRSIGIKYAWVHENHPGIFECTQNCTLPMDERSSSRVEYYVHTEISSPEGNNASSCQLKNSDKFLLKVVPLTIHGVTINDTGDYYCQASYLSSEGEETNLLKSKVEKITVVLYEFPEEEKAVTIGTDDSVACGVKTYSSANVSWWSNMDTLVPMIEEEEIVGEGTTMSHCDEQSDVFATRTITKQENGFSLFLITVHFCNLSPAHLGQYACVVDDETFDADIRNTAFTFTLRDQTNTTVSTAEPDTTSLSVTVIVCVCGGMLLFLLVVVEVVIVLVCFKKFYGRRDYYRKCSRNSTSKEPGERQFGRVYNVYTNVTPSAFNKGLAAVKTTEEHE